MQPTSFFSRLFFTLCLVLCTSLGLWGQTHVDYGKPQTYKIGGLRVTGNDYMNESVVLSMSGLAVGDEITIPGPQLTDLIRKLWEKGLLGDVQVKIDKIEGEEIFLNIVLEERARLSRFYFEGIPKGQANTLSDKIKLIRGKIVNDVVLKNTENTIKNFYREKGFRNCKVNIVKRDDPILKNSIQLRIEVDKGPRVKIEDIKIRGNEALTERKIRRKLKKTKVKKPYRLFAYSKFLEEEFKADKGRLVQYYNKLGYRDARVTYDTVYDVNEELVNVELDIYEGPKYYYRNITWAGNFIYDSTQLGQILGIERGDVYNVEELDKRLRFNPTGTDVTSLYMDDGYLFFSVEPVEVRVKGDSIDIEMRIFEGEQATINKVVLNGNTTTSDHVVRRQLWTFPGQKFSRSDIIRTQQELSGLGYFDPESIDIQPRPNMNDGTVDIHYNLTERSSDQVELSGGWGGAFGFVGTVGLVLNNFSFSKFLSFKDWRGIPQGDGQKVQLRVQANGAAFQTYSATFSEPWLGGKKPNNFSVNLQHSVQRRRRPGSFSFNDFQGVLTVTGVTVSLGRRVQFPDDFFSLSNSISLLQYRMKDFPGLFRTLETGTFNNLTFNTTLSRNDIDNPIYPRRGAQVTLSASFTPPYSISRGTSFESDADRFRWVEYHKWMFDNKWFLNVAGKLVLATRAHMGFIGSYNKNMGVSPFERFILGGDGLTFGNFLLGTDIIGLRGYENQSIVPLDQNIEGGVVYNKYVMELRYPLTLSPATSIYVLSFLEAGNNWGSFNEFNPFDLRRSAGFGARIFMPAFGMLGVDWAYGFDDIPGDNTIGPSGAQFHFTIGQQLR